MTGENSSEGHSHSFYRDGDDKRVVRVEVRPILFINLLLGILITLHDIGRRDGWERQVGWEGGSGSLRSSWSVDPSFQPIVL